MKKFINLPFVVATLLLVGCIKEKFPDPGTFEYWSQCSYLREDLDRDGDIDGDDYELFRKGEKGDKGDPGKDGLSAYEVWVKEVNEGTYPDWGGGITVLDFFNFLHGEDGENPDPITIEIGENGNWYIGGNDTGVSAKGPKGDKGDPGDDGRDGRDGDDGEPGEDGEDLDKPDDAYIDVTKQNIDIFYKGSGGAFTVKANYPWTMKVLSEHTSISSGDYLKITPTYGTTYTMPDGSTFTTPDGSVAWTSLEIPDRDLTFEIRFETHNGDWRWVHESIFITIHASGL